MPQIQAGETFAVGQQLTATRANNHVNGATLLNGAVTEQVVPGVAITPIDTVLLTHSTLRNRLERVSVNQILNEAVDITATGDITAGGKIEGGSLNINNGFGEGLIFTYQPGGPTSLDINLSAEIQINASHASIYTQGSQGTEITTTGGPLVLQSTWVDPLGSIGNIRIYGDLDITNANSIVNNGIDYKNKILAPIVYSVETELKNNILCQRNLNGVINVSVANFTAAVPAGPTTLFSESFVVPDGEKWIVEFSMSLVSSERDDTFYFGWFVDNTVQQYHTDSIYIADYYTKNYSFTLVIDNTAGVSNLTKNVEFKGAPVSGTGNDWVIVGDLIGLAVHPSTYSTKKDFSQNNKWRRTITKLTL